MNPRLAPGDPPVDTPATRAARRLGVRHEVLIVEPARDVREAAERLGVDPDRLLKTIVVRRADGDHLLVVVPGPRRVSWPHLRRHLGVSRVSLPDADAAREVTGYERGTITPFGASGDCAVLVDASVVGHGEVTIGGGAHGVSLRVDADELVRVLDAEVVELTSPPDGPTDTSPG